MSRRPVYYPFGRVVRALEGTPDDARLRGEVGSKPMHYSLEDLLRIGISDNGIARVIAQEDRRRAKLAGVSASEKSRDGRGDDGQPLADFDHALQGVVGVLGLVLDLVSESVGIGRDVAHDVKNPLVNPAALREDVEDRIESVGSLIQANIDKIGSLREGLDSERKARQVAALGRVGHGSSPSVGDVACTPDPTEGKASDSSDGPVRFCVCALDPVKVADQIDRALRRSER